MNYSHLLISHGFVLMLFTASLGAEGYQNVKCEAVVGQRLYIPNERV